MIEKMKRNWKKTLAAVATVAAIITSGPVAPFLGLPTWATTGATAIVAVNETVQSGALDKPLAILTGHPVEIVCSHPGKLTPCVTCHDTSGGGVATKETVRSTTCETCHETVPDGEGGGR